jgi:membrane protein YqaA with SNARE-associated domain
MQEAIALKKGSPGRCLPDSTTLRTAKVHLTGRQPVIKRSGLKVDAGKLAPSIAALAFSAAVTAALFFYRDALASLGAWGYLGVFLAELGSSASVVLPLPAHNYAMILSFTLNPFLIGLAGGIGAGLGEMTGYVVGTGGRQVLNEGRWFCKFKALAERRFGLALFVFAVVPAPFDFAGIAAGAAGYPMWRFLTIVIAGKILKVTLLSLAAYYGLSWVI